MTRISLTDDMFGDFEVEDGRLIGVYGPASLQGDGLDDVALRERIRNPIGAPPLREISKGAGRVLIVTDDNTRHTPLHRVVPIILEELAEAGVSDSSIRILIGLGTHRAMTDEEIRRKFGDDLVARFEILNHEWKNPVKLISLGKSGLGFDVLMKQGNSESGSHHIRRQHHTSCDGGLLRRGEERDARHLRRSHDRRDPLGRSGL